MTATSEHLLYKAAVSFMVSERTGVESWEMVAKFAASVGNSAALRKEFAVVEQQIKADFKIDALPSAWRSAKSVALKAVLKGVALVDSHTGAVKGKTAVEKQCKPAASVPVAMTLQQELFFSTGKATGVLAKKGFVFEDEHFKTLAVKAVEMLLEQTKKAKVK